MTAELTAVELRIARVTAGLSRVKACRLTGVPYNTWLSWETTGQNGRRPNPLAFAWLELYHQKQGESK